MDQSARRKIIIPLDVSTKEQALAIIGRLRGRAGMFKVGLQLFCAEGPDLVARITGMGERVFLDLKLHDIPNTVAGAMAGVARLGAAMINVHLSGGERMIRAAAEALEPGREARPLLLGVTVLTSLDQGDLAAMGVRAPLIEHVVSLARMGQRAGLDGVVASPHEIAAIKDGCGDRFVVVTPGVRPAGQATHDQVRVMTPAQAIRAGAGYLVIGRPILEGPDPVAALEAIVEEIS